MLCIIRLVRRALGWHLVRCCSAGGIGVPAVHCVRHVPSGDVPDAVPIPTLVGDLRMCMAKTFVIKVSKHLYPRHKRLARHHALWLASASAWLVAVAVKVMCSCILHLAIVFTISCSMMIAKLPWAMWWGVGF